MDLFSRKYARPLILRGNNAITSFASSIFRAAGCSADSASQVMAVLQLPFAVASIILTEKAGRRLLMLHGHFSISLRYLSLHGISMDTVRSLFNIYSFFFINYFMALEES